MLNLGGVNSITQKWTKKPSRKFPVDASWACLNPGENSGGEIIESHGKQNSEHGVFNPLGELW